MPGCPVVEDVWSKIGPAGPGHRSKFRVDSRLGESSRIPQRSENSASVPQMRRINIAHQAVSERQPKPVVAQDPDFSHVVEGRRHRRAISNRHLAHMLVKLWHA